nr:hypothetical protein [Methylomarinovum sp. IN45]
MPAGRATTAASGTVTAFSWRATCNIPVTLAPGHQSPELAKSTRISTARLPGSMRGRKSVTTAATVCPGAAGVERRTGRPGRNRPARDSG